MQGLLFLHTDAAAAGVYNTQRRPQPVTVFSLKREWTRETKLQNELGQQDYQASVEEETETMLLLCFVK